jgi:hypothetical protein
MKSGSQMWDDAVKESRNLDHLRTVANRGTSDRDLMQHSGMAEDPEDLRRQALKQIAYEDSCRRAGIPCSQ